MVSQTLLLYMAYERFFCKNLQECLFDYIFQDMEWIKDYMKEVSVIILGLCITYWGDSVVDGIYEAQDDREYKEMLMGEIEANVKEIENMKAYYRSDLELAAGLKRFLIHGCDTADAEKVKHLFNQHRMYHYWILKENVFSMIKLSATIQRIDKQLLSSLYDCYDYMDTVMDMGESYRERRFEELLRHMPEYGDRHRSAKDVFAQWEAVADDSRFSSYIIKVVPQMAGSALAICSYTEQMLKDILVVMGKE